jgi:hypothetical protein
MLIRFCAATNSVDAARVGGKLAFDVLRFGLWDVVFADIDSPEMAGQAHCCLTLTLLLSSFDPDLQLLLHAGRREGLRHLVNQS